MIVAVWGRDGIGKTTLCDALSVLLAKEGITAIIDTDLTQPTLPLRIPGRDFDIETSLGKALAGVGIGNAARYLHQHSTLKTLFFAGLTDKDEYLSYELGLETTNAAQDFVEQCSELVDTIILDLSGQRNDPFIPYALGKADKVFLPITPDIQGVCWFNAVKHLLDTMKASRRVLPIAAMADRHHEIPVIEKTVNLQFAAELPYAMEFRQTRDAGLSPLDGTTPSALRYAKQVQKLYKLLKEVNEQ